MFKNENKQKEAGIGPFLKKTNVPYKWLDSNSGPLVSEMTALPTEPQPLITLKFVCYNSSQYYKTFLEEIWRISPKLRNG